MKFLRLTMLLALLVAAVPLAVGRAAPPDGQPELPTEAEARARARLLHETMHATLQIVHHEYYREDEGLAIPAATLKRVFKEMATRQQVELRWLAVDAQAMNTDHQARDDFESGQSRHSRQAKMNSKGSKRVSIAGQARSRSRPIVSSVIPRTAPVTRSGRRA